MKRNSILEVYKFLFAIVILIFHNNFIIEKNYVSYCARFVVCFFFLISGFYLFSSLNTFIEKHEDEKFLYFKFIWHKLKKFGIPLLIAYVFSIIDTIVNKTYSSGFLHYLWFIHILLIFEGFALLLFKYVKKNYIINIIFIISMITGTILRCISSLSEVSEALCFIYVPLGYYLSKIKIKYKSNILYLSIAIILLIPVIIIIGQNKNTLLEFTLDFLVLPIMLLCIQNTDFKSNKILNYLGYLSFEIYVYQSITRIFYIKEIGNHLQYFLTIVGAIVVTEVVRKLIKIHKNKRMKKNEELLIA